MAKRNKLDRSVDAVRDTAGEDDTVRRGELPPGRSAAYVDPFFIPDYELLPRDDSGGPEFEPYTMEFGDGGYTTGDKAHLSPRGGRDDRKRGDEEDRRERGRGA